MLPTVTSLAVELTGVNIYMPLPQYAPHSATRASKKVLRDWVEAFDLVNSERARRSLARIDLPLIAGLYYPTACSNALDLVVKKFAWGFTFDDAMDDGPEGRDPVRCRALILDILGALHGQKPTTNLARAARDSWQELAEGRSDSWRNTYRANVADWLWSHYAEGVDRALNRIPSPADFRVHRRSSVGIFGMLDLCEVTSGDGELPDGVRRLPAFRTLRQAAVDHIAMLNDLFSDRKETLAGYEHNAVRVLERHASMTRQNAANQVNVQLTKCIQSFLQARTVIPEELAAAGFMGRERDTTLRTCDNYLRMVRGNYDWHLSVDRYRDPEIGTVDTEATH